MHPAYLPVVAALAGSIIGGLTSITIAWLTQNHQASTHRLAQEKNKRQKLYMQFHRRCVEAVCGRLGTRRIGTFYPCQGIFFDQQNARLIELPDCRKGAQNRPNDRRHVFLTEHDISRVARPDQQSRNRSTATVQRGLPKNYGRSKILNARAPSSRARGVHGFLPAFARLNSACRTTRCSSVLFDCARGHGPLV